MRKWNIIRAFNVRPGEGCKTYSVELDQDARIAPLVAKVLVASAVIGDLLNLEATKLAAVRLRIVASALGNVLSRVVLVLLVLYTAKAGQCKDQLKVTSYLHIPSKNSERLWDQYFQLSSSWPFLNQIRVLSMFSSRGRGRKPSPSK